MPTSSSDARERSEPLAAGVVDTHCHLDATYFPEGPDAVLERARAAGVAHVVAIGVDRTGAAGRFVADLAARRDDVSAVVGLHPHDASALDDVLFGVLESLCRRPEVVAVGETGLDYHYRHSPVEVQGRTFGRMIALARAVRKPIVVHTREAPEQTLRILTDHGAAAVGGIFHCFSEDVAFARRALDLGFDLAFSGIVTVPRAASIREVARWAPADRILVETDSPYLAPVPLRGQRNEPAYVGHTIRCLAELRGEPLAELVAQTSRNAARRLGIRLAATPATGRRLG
jgi:TatD DNase family protein